MTTTTTDHPPAITPSEVMEQLDAGHCYVIDVRTPAEFEAARIDGTLNLPLDTLECCRDTLRDLGAEIVLVCKSGVRAGKAAEQLDEIGSIRLLEGGIDAWQQAGFPVHTGRKRWTIERQVRLVAGSIVLGSIIASVGYPKAKWAAAFIGGGLTFAGLTDICGMGLLLAKMPWNRTATADVEATLASLAAAA
ncbi:MAG: rhodanese-like domain-containing protein [Acidimicrobiia bacterium]|nr:rhodanese-like domain-containing protein [Acidimicrobiia bacterium]